MKRNCALVGMMLAVCALVSTPSMATNPVGEYFQQYNGTFVIRDIRTNETQIFNEELAKEKLPPQSTFKVPNFDWSSDWGSC